MQVRFTMFRERLIRHVVVDGVEWLYLYDIAKALDYCEAWRLAERVAKRGPVTFLNDPSLPPRIRAGRWASLQALNAYAERAARYHRKPASADLLDWLYTTFNLKSKPAPQPVTGLDEAIARAHRDVLQLLGEPTP